MNFNSLHFVLFFAIVLPLVLLLRRKIRSRNVFLLAASYYFYGTWDYRFLALIIVSTLVDYLCGLWFDVREATPGQPPRRSARDRLVLFASLATNLGILGFFKYYGFFATSAAELLNKLGFSAHPSTLDLILPVGISFYTFQTLSYTIDVYRGRIPTERSLLNFAVYVAFFPQLVAGPIERAERLLPQVGTPRRITWPDLYSGFYLICWGLFKKVVLADNVATVADRVFSESSFTGLATLLGVYAFAIQIYCDFSGYTDVARGAARCMGFDLMLNFNLPYFATNPSDFWRRWHISLSTWLRDYLYIPLGGNKKGRRRTYLNLMLTMVLGGLWHGAAWTFVLWGFYHGALLCIHRLLRPWLDRVTQFKHGLVRTGWFWIRVIIFFHLVCFGWLLFRADSLHQVSAMVVTMISSANYSLPGWHAEHVMRLAACLAVLAGIQMYQWRRKDLMSPLRLTIPIKSIMYSAGLLGFILFGNYSGQPFIYFQF